MFVALSPSQKMSKQLSKVAFVPLCWSKMLTCAAEFCWDFLSFESLRQISIIVDEFRHACHFLIVCAEREHFANNFLTLRMRVVDYSLLNSGPTIPRISWNACRSSRRNCRNFSGSSASNFYTSVACAAKALRGRFRGLVRWFCWQLASYAGAAARE